MIALNMTDDLKILIVDNDDAHRTFFSKVLAETGGAEVVDTASSGRMAIAKLKQKTVDLVFLAMELPLMDGLETLEKLRDSHPDIGVVILSTSPCENNEKIVKALQMGALDFVSKAGLDVSDGGSMLLRRRLLTLMGLFRARRNANLAKQLQNEYLPVTNTAINHEVRRPVPPSEVPSPGTRPQPERLEKTIAVNRKVELLAMGVSTGGPNALAQVIPLLPVDLGVPVLLVQHMPATLTVSLADSLNRKSALQVREAADGEEILPNMVYLAPGGKHMVAIREKASGNSAGCKRIRITSDPPVNSCRPSADVLFRSAAEAFDGRILAVIMTGMGSDGTEGIRELKRNGCYCLAQTEETCVVYGMPRSVIEAGLADEKVPLDHLARRIVELVKGRNSRIL